MHPRTLRASLLLTLWLTLALLALPGCGPDTSSTYDTVERCADGIDNTGDGLIDCASPDCAAFPACIRTTRFDREHCSNGLDDTGDGLIDCQAPECADTIVCARAGEDCANGLDDDGDGLTDCEDPKCQRTSVCAPGAEACTSGMDEDGDGLIDCEDPDCQGVWICLGLIEFLGNGVDDNGDGLADCEDPTWANTSACREGGENCTNGMDDDGDGAIDCADVDCQFTISCLGITELCDNGVDDNLDGLTDCDDPQCVGSPACIDLCALPGSQFFADCLAELPECLLATPIRCDAPECADLAACQCPLVEGEPLCTDVRCADEPGCQPPSCPFMEGSPDCDDPLCQELSPECACPAAFDAPACAQLNHCDAVCACPPDGPAPSDPALMIPDCAHPACAAFDARCMPGPEICDDGIDNDGDGLTDCQDWVTCGQTDYCIRQDCVNPSTGNIEELVGDLVISNADTLTLDGTPTQWADLPLFSAIRGSILVERAMTDDPTFSLGGRLDTLRCVFARGSGEEMDGSLHINAALSDALGLQQLTRVEGSLSFIWDAGFGTTHTLERLRYVGHSLYVVAENAPFSLGMIAAIERVDALLALIAHHDVSVALDLTRLDRLRHVNGLFIEGFRLRDLSGLEWMTQIAVLLNLRDIDGFESFKGLERVTHIEDLRLERVHGTLQDLTSLSSLTTLGQLHLEGVSSMQTLRGLEQITTLDELVVDGMQDMEGTTGLVSMEGLDQLTEVLGITFLGVNTVLADINALSNIQELGELWISGMPLITELPFGSLTRIRGNLVIQASSMSTLDSFSALTVIDGALGLMANSDLVDISALLNVTEIHGTLISITHNPLLTTAALAPFLDAISAGTILFDGTFRLCSNADSRPC